MHKHIALPLCSDHSTRKTTHDVVSLTLHLLPVAARLLLAGNDAGEPFDAACARRARHHHPHREAMVQG